MATSPVFLGLIIIIYPMGLGFRFNLKWVSSVQPSSFTSSSSSSRTSSYSFRGMEASYDTAKVSFSSIVSEESESVYNDLLRAHSRTEGDHSTFLTSLQAGKASHFKVLMNNLSMLEKTFADSDAVRLEKDILEQLERLGALSLFHTSLSRSRSRTLVDSPDMATEFSEELGTNNHMAKIVVSSAKKEKRKEKRMRASEKAMKRVRLKASISTNNLKDPRQQNLSSSRKSSKLSGRRPKITRNEAEMSKGVKLAADLDRIRRALEEETGQTATLSCWAEAAGVDKKTLQQNLHFGWCCKDALLRSTRSLIIYIAKNYKNLGVGFEDLIQAGRVGVLQGAERFDHTRGYKFSTYIQYWIRKSMLMLLERHSRGVRIPFALSNAIKKIQKARKTLCNNNGTYPDDEEIAKYTGLSLSKISSASSCLRVVGSLDRNIGGFTSTKYLELTPDTSIKCPEETIMRQHMITDFYDFLNDLNPRERQVLVLRFGLEDHQCQSLQEIGNHFRVSKEWIRQIEKTALTKLKESETLHNLSYYLYM